MGLGMGTNRSGYGYRFTYPPPTKWVQEHLFWWRTDWDMANFVKIIKILCISAISPPFSMFFVVKPMWVMGQGHHGLGYGYQPRYVRVTCAIPYPWQQKAYQIAKNAAKGCSSATQNPPHIFRNPLPRSASAIKQAFNILIKATWARKWALSPGKVRIKQLGEKFLSKKHTNNIFKLSRNHSSTILQICSGHYPLNYYLHRVKKTATTMCQACQDEQNNMSVPQNNPTIPIKLPSPHSTQKQTHKHYQTSILKLPQRNVQNWSHKKPNYIR